jgi:hypothetical protein
MTKALKKLLLPADDMDLAAALLARFAFALDPELVEGEIFAIVQEYMAEIDLDYVSVDTLARLCRASKFNPETDLWN